MRKVFSVTVMILIAVGLATFGSLSSVEANSERTDCPGKIVCPLTGKPVCKDRCPIGAAQLNSAKDDPQPSCCAIPK